LEYRNNGDRQRNGGLCLKKRGPGKGKEGQKGEEGSRLGVRRGLSDNKWFPCPRSDRRPAKWQRGGRSLERSGGEERSKRLPIIPRGGWAGNFQEKSGRRRGLRQRERKKRTPPGEKKHRRTKAGPKGKQKKTREGTGKKERNRKNPGGELYSGEN